MRRSGALVLSLRRQRRGEILQRRIYQHPTVDQAFRAKASFACLSLLRVMHEAIRCYEGDLEAFVIYVSVACASTGGAMRAPHFLAQPLDSPPLPDTFHRPVSRRAIAASTGLPRETVRRKIAQLVERGLLVEEGRGVRTRSGVLEERLNVEFCGALIREIERGAFELARVDRAYEDKISFRDQTARRPARSATRQ